MLPLALLLSALLAGPATTQEGVVAGRVVDEAGAPVAGVTVTSRSLTAGEGPRVTTGADGGFRFAALAPGIYTFEFIAPGFRPARRPGIVLLAGGAEDASVRLFRDAASPTGQRTSTAATVVVRLETPFGAIDIAVETARAPVTAANFLKYVDGGFYDGGRFHRATRPDNYTPAPPDRPMMEIIQGGIDPARRADGFPPIPLERTSLTGLTHVTGVVSMARGTAADTARSDFFILLDDQPSLDFGGRRFEDGQGGAAFGRVTSGMDVVRRIQQQPVQGQSLTPPVPITRAYRVR